MLAPTKNSRGAAAIPTIKFVQWLLKILHFIKLTDHPSSSKTSEAVRVASPNSGDAEQETGDKVDLEYE
jgi:hypothetical protein